MSAERQKRHWRNGQIKPRNNNLWRTPQHIGFFGEFYWSWCTILPLPVKDTQQQDFVWLHLVQMLLNFSETLFARLINTENAHFHNWPQFFKCAKQLNSKCVKNAQIYFKAAEASPSLAFMRNEREYLSRKASLSQACWEYWVFNNRFNLKYWILVPKSVIVNYKMRKIHKSKTFFAQ